jgi:hypothetical protein
MPLIYSKTHFHFSDPTDVTYFISTILSHRLDLIRYVHLDWILKLPTEVMDTELYPATFEILSNMKGLKELRLHTLDFSMRVAEYVVSDIRQLLGKVRGLDVYELVVKKDEMPLWRQWLGSGLEIQLVEAPERMVGRTVSNTGFRGWGESDWYDLD